MNAKKIIIILGVVLAVLVIALGVLLAVRPTSTPESENESNANVTQANQQIESANTSGASGVQAAATNASRSSNPSSTSTTETDGNTAPYAADGRDGEASSGSEPDASGYSSTAEGSSSLDEIHAGSQIEEVDGYQIHGLSPAGERMQAYLANFDQQRLSDTAVKFLDAFLNYDSRSIRDGSYKAGFISYVSSDTLASGSASDLLTDHANDIWAHNVSQSDRVYSRVRDIQALAVYVPDLNKKGLAVSLHLTGEMNSQTPMAAKDWESINRIEADYAVYFNEQYQVTDVKEQKRTVLEFNINNWQETLGYLGD